MGKARLQDSPPNLKQKPRVDFQQDKFESLIWQKGYPVIWERAIKCPCKEEGKGPQANCLNCYGLGWIFTEFIETRIVVQSINKSTKFKDWSMELLGTVSLTARHDTKLAFMDRITLKEINAIFSEVRYVKTLNGTPSIRVTYPVESISYISYFNGLTNPLIKIPEVDYTILGNVINLPVELNGKQITIRYSHHPQYHVLDLPREVIQSSVINSFSGKEEILDFPIHAIARRSQYIFDEPILGKTPIYNEIT